MNQSRSLFSTRPNFKRTVVSFDWKTSPPSRRETRNICPIFANYIFNNFPLLLINDKIFNIFFFHLFQFISSDLKCGQFIFIYRIFSLWQNYRHNFSYYFNNELLTKLKQSSRNYYYYKIFDIKTCEKWIVWGKWLLLFINRTSSKLIGK